jgi:hypothetical protein
VPHPPPRPEFDREGDLDDRLPYERW